MLVYTLLKRPIQAVEQSQRVWFDSPSESQLQISEGEMLTEARFNLKMLHAWTEGHHKEYLLNKNSGSIGSGLGA